MGAARQQLSILGFYGVPLITADIMGCRGHGRIELGGFGDFQIKMHSPKA